MGVRLPSPAALASRRADPGTQAALLRLQATAGNQAIARLLAAQRPSGRVVQRHVEESFEQTPDGTKVLLDPPGHAAGWAPPVELTLWNAPNPPSPNHVTTKELLRIEKAWQMILSDQGGLQLRHANVADPEYLEEEGRMKTAADKEVNPRHGTATGTGKFEKQKRTLLARVAAEIARSAAARQMVEDIVGTEARPQRHVIRLFLGEGAAGFYDTYSDFGMDIEHEKYVHEDPSKVGGDQYGGLTRGELLMHVLEERYHMVRGMTYLQAHAEALKPDSLQNKYREERAKAAGGQGAKTAPTVALDCTPYNAPAGPAPDKKFAPMFDPAREKDLQDFVAIDAVGVVTRAKGIDTKHLFNNMPEPSTAFTTVGPEKDFSEEYFNKAYAYCIEDALAHHDNPTGPRKTNEVFQANTRIGRAHFDTVWTMVSGGFKPPAPQGTGSAAPNAGDPVAQQLQARWTADFLAAKKEVEARKKAIEAQSEAHRARLAAAPLQAGADADPGNRFLAQQRAQREAIDALNDAKRHQLENCAACSVGAIVLLSSGDLLMKYRRDILPTLGPAAQAQAAIPTDARQLSELKEKQNPEAWLTAKQPGAKAPGDPAGARAYESKIGDAVWEGIELMLHNAAAQRNGDAIAGGGAQWRVERWHQPTMPGEPDHRPDQGAEPLESVVLPKMRSYPNGTQFVLWVFAPPPDQMMHYLYAELNAGRVVVQDFQQQFTTPKRVARPARSAGATGAPAPAQPATAVPGQGAAPAPAPAPSAAPVPGQGPPPPPMGGPPPPPRAPAPPQGGPPPPPRAPAPPQGAPPPPSVAPPPPPAAPAPAQGKAAPPAQGAPAVPAQPELIYSKAHTYVDEPIAKPLAPFTPGYFTHGCFYALVPTFPAPAAPASPGPAPGSSPVH